VVHELNRTLARAGRCVAGVLERCADTREVLSHFVPWLNFSCNVSANRSPAAHTSRRPLSPEALLEIRRQNAAELAAYEVANLLLDAQLAATRAAR
jgi:hypothetical protein